MDLKVISFVLLFCYISQVTAYTSCQCSDYGTQLGCNNFASGCYWSNNECVQYPTDCTAFSNAQTCRNPGCQWRQNNVCVKFTSCENVDQFSNPCITFGCVPANPFDKNSYCTAITNCTSIQSQGLCDGLKTIQDKKPVTCAWSTDYTVSKLSQCVEVSQCLGTPLDICSKLPECSITGVSGSCTDVDCSGLTQPYCAQAVCLWQTDRVSSDSAVAGGHCIKNDCGHYLNEITCHTQYNKYLCAWNGKSCNQCQNFGSLYKLAVTIITLFVFTVIS